MDRTLKTLISIEELMDWRRNVGGRVGFVPTMGALHAGHLSLMAAARSQCERDGDQVVVSIFVNPTQFGPGEDFAKYPRTLDDDLEKCRAAGADAVFVPNAAAIYPEGAQTYVVNEVMANTLDGVSRPGHFRGVLTVVLKLLQLVQPHAVYFGKKDYQQWRLIERMVRDLFLPVDVVGCPIIREQDGLAMSSRNRYLSDDERRQAALLSRGLAAASDLYKKGHRRVDELKAACQQVLDSGANIEPEYIEVRDQAHLGEFADEVVSDAVMLVAARLGDTRLIDNLELGS